MSSSSSASPSKINPKLIFAYPTKYTSAFSDACDEMNAEDATEEQIFAENYENTGSECVRKSSNASEDTQPRSRRTSWLAQTMAEKCIDEESPRELQSAVQADQKPFVGETCDLAAYYNYAEYSPSGAMMDMGSYYDYSPSTAYMTIAEMARDQNGCRVLQSRLEEGELYSVNEIFDEVIDYIPGLLVDPFGNYLCQKLMEVVSAEQLGKIIANLAPHVLEIGMNMHGTRAVQKLIQVVTDVDQICRIKQSLIPYMVSLIKDINGNHIIQRCLFGFNDTHNQFVFEAAQENVVELATHRHGCCVLQRCIDAATDTQRQSIVDCIVNASVVLIQDAFGNYVVQYVLDLNNNEVNARLAYIFIERIVELSKQKFSSNVIEKCLQQTDPDVQLAMIREIGKQENLVVMLVDQYANYVVQRAMALAPPYVLDPILNAVKESANEIKFTTLGKKIYAKLANTYSSLY